MIFVLTIFTISKVVFLIFFVNIDTGKDNIVFSWLRQHPILKIKKCHVTDKFAMNLRVMGQEENQEEQESKIHPLMLSNTKIGLIS